MFFGKKKKQTQKLNLQKDPFPDQELLESVTIIDIRDEEDIEDYGAFDNSIHIPYDDYFASKLMMLDKSKKYGVMDLKGVYAKKAAEIAREVGLDALELKGGFFYITEVLNIKPKEQS